MERRTAVGLATRYVAIWLGVVVLAGVLVAVGIVLAPGGGWGMWNALTARNVSGFVSAAGVGLALFGLALLVVFVGRIAALQYFIARTVREALDEEVARIERDLAREVRGIRRTAEGEDVAGRLDSLERDVDRLRAAAGETYAGRTPATSEPVEPDPTASETEPAKASTTDHEREPPESSSVGSDPETAGRNAGPAPAQSPGQPPSEHEVATADGDNPISEAEEQVEQTTADRPDGRADDQATDQPDDQPGDRSDDDAPDRS